MRVEELELTIYGNPVLRRQADEVALSELGPDLDRLVKRMFEVMYEEEGVGLAAPQIGVSKRIFVIDVPVEGQENRVGVMINPKILETHGTQDGSEGCLSIPGLREDVTRHAWLRVRGLDARGKEVEFECDDLLARAVQHEVDHLDGVLYVDRLSPLKRKLLTRKLKEIASENAPRAAE
jgi:peptide deformylase